MAKPPPAAVPDTSVVLKWFLHEQEPLRQQALALRQAYLQGTLQLVIPDLLPHEFGNVLRYKPGWDSARVELAVRSLYALKLEVAPVNPELLARAVALAFACDITVYDAAFVALAAERGTVFISADEKLVRRLAGRARARPLSTVPTI